MSELKQGSPSRLHGRFSITTALMLVIGLLTLVSVGTVLGIGIWLGQKNTFALLGENAQQAVQANVNSVRQYLSPVEKEARFLAERIASGELDPGNHREMELVFTGVLAAAEQIERLMFVDLELQAFVTRYRRRFDEVNSTIVDYAGDPIVVERMRELTPGANWGKPEWRESARKTYLDLAYPVYRDGEFAGAIMALLPLRHLSEFISSYRLGEAGNLFVLSGRDQVLGHSRMRRNRRHTDEGESPMPRLRKFDDPVLAAFWNEEGRGELRRLELPEEIEGHSVDINGQRYVFIYKEITEFGPEPLIAGGYFPRSEFGEEIRRVALAMGAGGLALILALLAAIYTGRKIAKPIVDFSDAAARVRNLDLEQVDDLPGSAIRELNEQSAAFNAMLRALRWFELYVPNSIVAHLVQRGSARKTVSDARNITVMFTDIVGFSGLSEGMSATEVAELLNHHFTMIGSCIDDQGGTIDKYIGDSVMAFWGAPEKLKNRAERACQAALDIARTIRDDNARRRAKGLPPIGIRIGIHTGDVTVGNIGTPERINYTIIGDAVNIGVRLEQLGKDVFPPGTEVSILLSADTARDLGESFKPVCLGVFRLKGRDGEVEVFSLDPGEPALDSGDGGRSTAE